MMPGPLQVALVQANPVHADLAATMDKVESLARDAAAQGAQLVVFGETFITGYPAWIDSSPGAGTLYKALLTFGSDGSLQNHHRKLVPT